MSALGVNDRQVSTHSGRPVYSEPDIDWGES